MDRAHYTPEAAAALPARAAASTAPQLRLVAGGLRLAEPVAAPDPQWQAGFAGLRDWLGIALDPAPAPRATGLRQMAGWVRGAAPTRAPLFAPWQPLSPVALQHGGSADTGEAEWLASYLFEHGPGSAVRGGTLDLALLSPHPAACASPAEGDPPLPRAAVLAAMLGAVRAEGRGRVALVVSAAQRNAMARLLMAAGPMLPRDDLALEVLPIEAALAGLACARPRWDAVIVMPEWRSIVFALLAESTARKGPWPLLGFAGDRTLVLAGSEALVEPGARLPLDAPVLIQTLALTLHHAGMTSAARRLHMAAARLRDAGVVTVSRGSSAPYTREIDDAELLRLVSTGMGEGPRPAPHWQALGPGPDTAAPAPQTRLSLIAANPSLPSRERPSSHA